MISQIFLNKSINRILKKNLEFLPLFESNEIHIFIHKIVLYQIQCIAQIQAYKWNNCVCILDENALSNQQAFQIATLSGEKKTVRKKAELHSNTNKCTI